MRIKECNKENKEISMKLKKEINRSYMLEEV
jgi:hypothetical protein